MSLKIEDYSWKDDGLNSVHIGVLYVSLNRNSMENAEGVKDLHAGTAAGAPYTDGDVELSDVFMGSVPEGREGDTIEITFHCQSGYITWTYELQNR